MYVFGSIPILYYTFGAGGISPSGNFFLLTNLTNLLLTDLTNLKLAGS